MTLPKHLRQRWRYLAVGVESWPEASVERDPFQRALWYGAQDLVGDVGSATVDLTVQRFRYGDGEGEAAVRTRRGAVERARAVIASVDEVAGDPVGLRVRGVSGTLRGCEEKYMGGGPVATEQRHVTFEGADRTATLRGGRATVRVDGAPVGVTTLDI
ncbi:Rpp14/Pop5 family protein [Salinirussus salinus]|uniref:Rpp14/Pop5 family protein n=1 Tax=Salinirussus salinus TaxID=1198300 RepID=UPI00135BBD66|nr:Rpp14/Pop5 family protein [Salinirussus salinus]